MVAYGSRCWTLAVNLIYNPAWHQLFYFKCCPNSAKGDLFVLCNPNLPNQVVYKPQNWLPAHLLYPPASTIQNLMMPVSDSSQSQMICTDLTQVSIHWLHLSTSIIQTVGRTEVKPAPNRKQGHLCCLDYGDTRVSVVSRSYKTHHWCPETVPGQYHWSLQWSMPGWAEGDTGGEMWCEGVWNNNLEDSESLWIQIERSVFPKFIMEIPHCLCIIDDGTYQRV